METIPPAPAHERPTRTHPTALDALEAAATAVAGMLRLPGSPTAVAVDEFGRAPGFEEQVRPLLEWIYERWFRVVARGFEDLPRDVPLVLVANRAGALPWDSLILSLAARRAGLEVRPLVEDSIFHFPTMGLLVNRLGAVRACPENAERILGRGGAVAVFPEGATGFGKPYRERYHLQRFGRGGFLRLALRMEALVVPVAIVGSEEIYPLLGKVSVRPFGFPFLPITPTFPWLGLAGLLPLPARWHIDVGEPFDFRAYGRQAAQDEPLVMRLAEEVRGTVQHLLDARLGQRRSVFR
ncbi:MAG TPA: lysophospholipid acyltransferase family protein [Vulgatibacter sp.]|nr:lysophospholipid acyltransferase family protein [Vulgatibacter sp.]